MRLVLRRGALRELRNSPEVVAEISARAERVKQAAGDRAVLKPPETGDERARRAVVAGDFGSTARQAAHESLLRAMDAGR